MITSKTQHRVAELYNLGLDCYRHRDMRGYMARIAQANDRHPGSISKARAVVEAAAHIDGDSDAAIYLRMFWEQATGSERGIRAAADELLCGNPWPWMAVLGASENAYHTMNGEPVNKIRKAS